VESLKLTRNLWLTEFIPPEILENYGGNALWFIDQRIINICQFIRDRFEVPITINNWFSGGPYRYSAYRDPASTVGALLSQHKAGRAADFRLKGVDSEEIRQDIINNWPLYQDVGLTTIERGTPTWVHIDCRNTGRETLFIVNP